MRVAICIVLTFSVLVGCLIIAFAIYNKPEGRYCFAPSSPPGMLWVMDTRTGEIYSGQCGGTFKAETDADTNK